MKKAYINPRSILIQSKALSLTEAFSTTEGKVNAIFNYIRDDIKFAFLKDADFVTDEEVLQFGKGQCNNKTILFQSLCEASGIESRMHFSSIKKNIHFGLFKGLLYKLMPNEISHSWIEIKLKDGWFKIDSYINDLEFYNGGKKKLLQEGIKTGYSVSCANGASTPDLDFSQEGFVQMDAVLDDHGTYTDPNNYFASSMHKNNPNRLKMFMYRLNLNKINKRVEKIRNKQ